MTIKSIGILYLLLGTMVMGYGQKTSNYTQSLPGVDIEFEMVAIPSGTFLMGSPKDELGRKSDEGPVREIEVEGFWMSKFEITWEVYNLFIERAIDNLENEAKVTEVNLEIDAVSGATTPYVDMSLGMGREEGYPAVNITQRAASAFCEWLSAITGRYYRLPTEVEWEYAARAGSDQPYYFGVDPSELSDHAWFDQNSGGAYHKVGTKNQILGDFTIFMATLPNGPWINIMKMVMRMPNYLLSQLSMNTQLPFEVAPSGMVHNNCAVHQDWHPTLFGNKEIRNFHEVNGGSPMLDLWVLGSSAQLHPLLQKIITTIGLKTNTKF